MAVDKNYVERIRNLSKDPTYREFLDLISVTEGTSRTKNGGYNTLFGFNKDGSNRYFDDMTKFPDSPAPYRDPRTGQVKYSNDAGRYQININTYKRMAKRLGITDFSPESQDMIAVALLDEIKGFDDAIRSGNKQQALKLASPVWVSLPYNKTGGSHVGESAALTVWDNISKGQGAQYMTPNGTAVPRTNQSYAGPQNYATNFFGLTGPGVSTDFFGAAMNNIMNRSYADPGNVPFQVIDTDSRSNSVYGAINDDPRKLVNRLFNKPANTTYGLSFFGSSLRPTVSVTDADGNDINMVELPNGNYINAATGERMNADGTVYEGTPVEYLTPDYEAPQNSPEAMEALRRNNELQAAPVSLGEETVVVAPDRAYLDYEGKINPTTAEAALPSGSTPPTTGNAASPVAYVNPNDVRVRTVLADAIGGDLVTRTMNGARDDVLGLGGDVIDLA